MPEELERLRANCETLERDREDLRMQLQLLKSELDRERRRLNQTEHDLNCYRVAPMKDTGDLLEAGCSGAAAAAPTRGPYSPQTPRPPR